MKPFSPAAHRAHAPIAIALGVFAVAFVVVGHWLFLRVPLIGDEPVHLAQVLRFASGEGGVHPWLTTFPTFHWLASWIVRALGSDSANTVRLAATLLGILVLPAAYAVARTRHEDAGLAAARAAGVVLLPILVPYLFFVYTDAAALAAILAATAFSLRRRWVLAGAFGLLALALRQTSIVWLAWLFAVYAWRERIWEQPGARWRRVAADSTFFGLAAVAFVVFVVANGGVAIGDASSHPLGLYDQNLLFFLPLVTLVLLPFLLLCAAETWSMVQQHPLTWTVVAIAVAAWFQLGWHVDHPYNLLPHHLHNDVAVWLNHAQHRALVTPLVTWSFLTLCRLSSGDAWTWAWAGATIVLLTPSWMVEHRYAITPLALWLLVRPAQSREREIALLAWIALLALGALWLSTLAPYGL